MKMPKSLGMPTATTSLGLRGFRGFRGLRGFSQIGFFLPLALALEIGDSFAGICYMTKWLVGIVLG